MKQSTCGKAELSLRVAKAAWVPTRDGVDYLYMDGCLHARLRDYGWKAETITGFEGKLCFLLTYVINYHMLSSMATEDTATRMSDPSKWKGLWDDLVDGAGESGCLKPVYGAVNAIFGDGVCKGIEILPAYHRAPPRAGFVMAGGIKGLRTKAGATAMEAFMEDFGIANGLASDFLRDDSYCIEIAPFPKVDCSKFVRKHETKGRKAPEEASLW